MGHDVAEAGAAKTKFLAWVPFVACVLAVIVDDSLDSAVVVTAYRTTRIQKYWGKP